MNESLREFRQWIQTLDDALAIRKAQWQETKPPIWQQHEIIIKRGHYAATLALIGQFEGD